MLAFALTWLLREVPLATSTHSADAIPPLRDERSAVEAAHYPDRRAQRAVMYSVRYWIL